MLLQIKNTTNLLIAISFFALFSSCTSDDENCPDEQVPYLLMSFEQANNVAITNIYIYNKQLADSLYVGSVNPDTVEIPLKLSADTTPITFAVKYTDSTNVLTDDIQLLHTHTIYSENIECGFTTVFNLNGILATGHVIDSIYILDTIINSDKVIHAKVFY